MPADLDMAIENTGLPAPPRLRAAEVALFADLDGTLAPLENTPGAVMPDPVRRGLLDGLLQALGGRLAIVSGRGLEDLDRVLENRIVAVAAVHGLVRRDGLGQVVSAGHSEKVDEAAGALRRFAKIDRDLLVENKGAAVALHFRRAPQRARACLEFSQRLAAALGLTLQSGDMVVELKTAGPDKGGALTAFMAEAPFAGFTPIFVGDDLTDESGFRAARALGGHGVIVGRRRPTAALYALTDVAAAQAWLGEALEGAG